MASRKIYLSRNIEDVEAHYPADNDALTWVAASGMWMPVAVSGSGNGGASAFTDLSDVPGSYSGQGGLVVAVKGTEDQLEFVAWSGGGGGESTAIMQNVVTVQASAQDAHGANDTWEYIATTSGIINLEEDGDLDINFITEIKHEDSSWEYVRLRFQVDYPGGTYYTPEMARQLNGGSNSSRWWNWTLRYVFSGLAAGDYTVRPQWHDGNSGHDVSFYDRQLSLKGSWAVTAIGGEGVTDHGDLDGLADDDHTQYLLADGSRICSGDFTVGDGTGSPTIKVDGVAGGNRNVTWQTAGINRWILRTDTDAEGGSNAGSNWELSARNDAGAWLSNPIKIWRATGNVELVPGGLSVGNTPPYTQPRGHLFIHDGSANDYGFFESEGGLYLSSNHYYDGSTWRAIKTGKVATLRVSPNSDSAFFISADPASVTAGDPTSAVEIFNIDVWGNTDIGAVLKTGAGMCIGSGVSGISPGDGAAHFGAGIVVYGSVSGAAGTTGGLEMEWDSLRSDLLSYNRNTSTYQPLRFRASEMAFAIAGTTKLTLKTDGDFYVNTDTHISGGLGVGAIGFVTTAGRIKANENLYLGGGIVIGYISGTADVDSLRFYSGTTLTGTVGTDDANWLRINQDTSIPTYSPQYFYGAAGLRAGSAAAAPSGGDITFSDRIIKDHGGTDYSGNIYVPVTPDIHGTSWWATAKSTGGTTITVSTTFPGVPANVRAIVVRIMCRDSAAHPQTGLYFIIGPDSTTNDNVGARAYGDQMIGENTGICNVTSNTIYAYRVASGSLTLDCWLAVIGYFI